MRTEEWSRNCPVRAERRISEAQENRSLDIGAIFNALREYSDDELTKREAHQLAPVLGRLRAEELLFLLHQASRMLKQEIESVVYRTESTVEQRLKELNLDMTCTIAQIRKEPELNYSGLAEVAIALQALAWAVCPTKESDRLICY